MVSYLHDAGLLPSDLRQAADLNAGAQGAGTAVWASWDLSSFLVCPHDLSLDVRLKLD